MKTASTNPSHKSLVARCERQGTAAIWPAVAGTWALGLAQIASGGAFPAEFELETLLPEAGGDGSAGFVIQGHRPDLYVGRMVKSAGDVNGDGVSDLIVGVESADPGGRECAGQTFVVFGRKTAVAGAFPALIPLDTLLPSGGGDGSRGFVLNGINSCEFSGTSVSGAGDINGDGIDDLVIGAHQPGDYEEPGQIYVVFGRDTAQLGNFPAVMPLVNLMPGGGGDGSEGFVLDGISADNYAGESVGAAGDVNGDEIDDLIIGAPRAYPGGRDKAGQIYVVFGRDTAQEGNFPAFFPLAALLPGGGGDGSAGFVLNGIDEDDHAGSSVSSAGDVNADGVDDFVIGAYVADPGGRDAAGESYVVFGRDTAANGNFPALFPLVDLLPGQGGDGTAGFVLEGIDAGDFSGSSVSSAGDVNADGIEDLIVGAHHAENRLPQSGQAYVILGRNTLQDDRFPAVFPLADLLPTNGGDGRGGFVIEGADVFDEAGTAVSAAGDTDGDGISDVIVGACTAGAGERELAGQAYLLFGAAVDPAVGFPPLFPAKRLLEANGGDGSMGSVLNGSAPFEQAGCEVSAAGDVNGDGIGDIVIGAFRSDRLYDDAGIAYVVFGRRDADNDGIHDAADNCIEVPNADQRDTNSDGFGNSCDPDLNNDGVVNFLDVGQLRVVFLTPDPDADFNGDGVVNFTDLGMMKAGFYGPPGPSGISR